MTTYFERAGDIKTKFRETRHGTKQANRRQGSTSTFSTAAQNSHHSGVTKKKKEQSQKSGHVSTARG